MRDIDDIPIRSLTAEELDSLHLGWRRFFLETELHIRGGTITVSRGTSSRFCGLDITPAELWKVGQSLEPDDA